MNIIAYLIAQSIVIAYDLMVLMGMAHLLPEWIELPIWDLVYNIVEVYNLPIYLGFD